MLRLALALALVLLPLAARADRDRPAPRRDAPPSVGQVIEETFAWCGKEGSCQCFQPLDCVGSACSTVESHLRSMQEILKGKKKGVAFVCQYAEEGTCGPWRYIYCDHGETQGTRLRFFDEQGRLAAAYWTSDYGEFCGGRAQVTYYGQIPSCQPLVRAKVIYGKGRTPAAPASRAWPAPR